MKCSIVLLCIFLIQFTKENKSISFLSTNLETEFESDLMKLLGKIHQKKVEQNNINKNFIVVKIRNFYDLREYLQNLKKIRNDILLEKDEDQKNLLELSERLDKYIKDNQDNLSKLKDKYDIVIEKSNNLNKDLNNKSNELVNIKSHYENEKSEFDLTNDKFLKNISAQNKFLNSNKENDLSKTRNYSKLNEKISELNSNLNKRNHLKKIILQTKESYEKNDIELNHLKLKEDEGKLDHKLFEIIKHNLENNMREMKSGFLNSTVAMNQLNKVLNDKENKNKLDIEKSQQNELYRDTNKKIKKILIEMEMLQNEVKDLMKRKNNLKENLNAKEIESNLKNQKLKSEINNLKNEIKKEENKIMNNVKEQKEFLLKQELKFKNLMLILNNLLLKTKNMKQSNNNETEGLLNNILFNNKILDMKGGVNHNIIEEINESILKRE